MTLPTRLALRLTRQVAVPTTLSPSNFIFPAIVTSFQKIFLVEAPRPAWTPLFFHIQKAIECPHHVYCCRARFSMRGIPDHRRVAKICPCLFLVHREDALPLQTELQVC